MSVCRHCDGEGMDDLLPCPECDGTGGELLGGDDQGIDALDRYAEAALGEDDD